MQADRHTNMLIALLRTPPLGHVNSQEAVNYFSIVQLYTLHVSTIAFKLTQ